MKEKNEILGEEQIYELGFHILPTVPEEKLQGVVSRLEDSITENKGSIISEEFPKMRVLSYEIKKRVETKYLAFDKAYFGWVKFETLPDSIDKIKKDIESNQDILRSIIVKTVKENTIHTPKSPIIMRENNIEEIKIPKYEPIRAEKAEISEAEIDKSIDELLVNEN